MAGRFQYQALAEPVLTSATIPAIVAGLAYQPVRGRAYGREVVRGGWFGVLDWIEHTDHSLVVFTGGGKTSGFTGGGRTSGFTGGGKTSGLTGGGRA